MIKGWLPAAGVKKIKFVAKATVGEFVRAEDRLTEWGGDFAYDPSKFDPGPGPAAPAEINGNVEDAKSAAEDTVSLASTIMASPPDNNAGGLLRLGPSANDIVFDKNGYGDLVARSETQNRIGCFILTVVERQVTSITESIQRNHRINPKHMYTYCTAVSSEGRAKLRDWAIWPVRAGCYSLAALSFPHSKPLYIRM